jgi:hypothetical protein
MPYFPPSSSGGGVDTQDEGTPLGTTTSLNFAGAGVTASGINPTLVTIPGGGGSATVTQVTVNLPPPAKRSHAVVVTDATVSGTSKIVLSLAGAPPSAVHEIEDIEMLSIGGLPAAGSFTFQAGFANPISGPILINYMVG